MEVAPVPLYTFVDNAVPSSSTWNANLRDQVITQCTSATRPASPVEGQFIFETDTDKTLYYSGSAWVEVFRGPIDATFTPTLTATTTNPTVTYSAQVGRYTRFGKRIMGDGRLAWSAVAVAGTGTFRVDLPIAPLASYFNQAIGSVQVIDSGTATYSGTLYAVVSTDGTRARAILRDGNVWAAGTPFTIAANDEISYQFNYEAA